MMHARRALLALLAAAAFSGCRALDAGSLSRHEPAGARTSVPLAELVERHNRNAELVQSLQASPAVSLRSESHGGGAAHGDMALERPRNFRMKLEVGINRQVADIGSNEDELWVWNAQAKEKAIYVCKYDGNGELPAELVFQPDWIIEGLGLRLISETEARQITVGQSKDPNVVVLVHRRQNGRGEPVQKLTVLNRATGAIRRHAFYGADSKAPIAWIEIEDHRRIAVPGPSGSAAASVDIPSRFRLISQPAGQERFEMSLTLNDLKVNPQFSRDQRDEIFAVPSIPNTRIVDVNEQLGLDRGPATVRESRPIPAAGSGVRLGEPVPIQDAAARDAGEPAPLSAELGPSRGGLSALVGAQYPHPSGDDEKVAAEAARLGQLPRVIEP